MAPRKRRAKKAAKRRSRRQCARRATVQLRVPGAIQISCAEADCIWHSDFHSAFDFEPWIRGLEIANGMTLTPPTERAFHEYPVIEDPASSTFAREVKSDFVGAELVDRSSDVICDVVESSTVTELIARFWDDIEIASENAE